MIVNGVTLPEIPAEMLAKYPNALILWSPQEVGSDGYMLFLTKGEIGYLPPSILGTSSPYLMSTNNGFARYMVAYPNNATEWILQAEMENYLMRFELLDTFSPVWANLDIYECTSLNLNTGAFTKGDIWFPNSESPKPTRYSIATTILDAVARQIMRLTDSTEKVKPEEFEPKLEGINIQLQELTVTATEEVQTITPPSGVYGFSKVIVEAVEDSGGSSGGGGTGEGGEGGEDGDQILSGDFVGFGNEYVEEEVPTGYCEYTSIYGQVGYMVPSPVEGAYIIANLSSGGISKMGVSSEPYTYTSRISTSAAKQKLYQHDASKGTAAWEYVGEFVTWNGGTVNWTNHDIYDSNGTLRYAKCPDPVPETVVTTVKKPVEYDAEYKISGESLNNIITLAQDVTGTKEPMTLDEAYAALDGYFNPAPTE